MFLHISNSMKLYISFVINISFVVNIWNKKVRIDSVLGTVQHYNEIAQTTQHSIAWKVVNTRNVHPYYFTLVIIWIFINDTYKPERYDIYCRTKQFWYDLLHEHDLYWHLIFKYMRNNIVKSAPIFWTVSKFLVFGSLSQYYL